jgi:hypothetical protein
LDLVWCSQPWLQIPVELRESSPILTLVIQVIAILLAIAIATGFLEAQMSYVLGVPSLLSTLWLKIAAVIICLIIALTAVSISNTLVAILF